MPESSPLIPGLEEFDPRRRMPFPENFAGTRVEISTERDIYMGIVPFSEGAQAPLRHADLTPERQLWEEAQGLVTARHLMRGSQAVFWGCPQGTFSVVVSEESCEELKFSSRSFSARLNIKGRVCLTRSGNVAMVCSYPDGFSHPIVSTVRSTYDDTPLGVAAGNYIVTVSQLFRWQKAQFAQTNPTFLHYHVAFRPISADSPALPSEIPWLSLPLPQ